MDKKTLHIDTLYLSYNCDFSAYIEAVQIISEKKHLYYRAGRQYYDFGFCRVGWLDWDICEKSKNYPFLIEYNFDYLYQTDLLINLDNLLLPFSKFLQIYLVKRVDYNCTFQTLNNNVLQSIFVSKFFKKGHDWWGGDRQTETVNLGLRKTGKTFRIYNKSKELSDKKNHIKNDILKQTFGTLSNLYSLEVELTRKYIISKLKNDGSLKEWSSILDLSKMLLGSIKFCDGTDRNLNLIRNKNYSRIDFTYITNFIGAIQDFKSPKKYKKSELNLLIAIDRILSDYNDYDGDVLSPDELGKKISELQLTKLINHK